MPIEAPLARVGLQIKSVRNPYQSRKHNMNQVTLNQVTLNQVTLNQVIKAINVADSGYGKVIAMIPSIKASGIKKDDLRKALQEEWGFKAMKPKSKEYNKTKVKVSYWIGVIFGKSDKPATKPTPFKLTRGLTDKFIQFLSENNIPDEYMKRAANALAANITLK